MANVSSSNSQKALVPKLRFRTEDGAEYPQLTPESVGSLFAHITRRNSDMANSNVITNSAEYGLIPQRDFFDKDIAVEGNTDKYYIIGHGDFVYNPRKSTTAPYGPFNCYRGEEEGVVSPLYTCLKPLQPELTEYLLWYFRSSAWHSYIYHNGAQGGARHDRVGMTNDLMDGIPINLPCQDEQKKISKFLSTIDARLSTQQRLVDSLKSYKRGVFEAVFSQKLCLADKGKRKAWGKYKLSDFASRITRRNGDCTDIPLTISAQYGLIDQRDFFSKTVASPDMSGYYLLHHGEYAYNRSTSNEYPFGSIKRLEHYKMGAVSTLYLCFNINEDVMKSDLVKWYFESSQWHRSVKEICAEGARNHGLLNVPTDGFFNTIHTLPSDPLEQEKIASYLSLLQNKYKTEQMKLESLILIQKALLRQLFI